jgi:hypothetical protein
MSTAQRLRQQVSVGRTAMAMAEHFDRLAMDRHREEQNQSAADDRVEVPEPYVTAMRAGRTPAVA